MVLTIEVELLAGRLHATPPGRHPSEGLVEWPPHPWRIQRAWLAVGFRTLGWQEPPKTARSLTERLAEVPPSFRLPRAPVPSERRSYVPIGEQRRELRDAFLAFPVEERLALRWPVELPARERELLDQLLEGWSWLGRSESWISARRVAEPSGDAAWMHPATDKASPAGHAAVRLRVPESPRGYLRAVEAALEVVLREASQKGRNATRDRARLRARFPPTMFDALLIESRRLLSEHWSHPPGYRWVDYDIPRIHLPAPSLGPPPQRGAPNRPRPEASIFVPWSAPAKHTLEGAEELHRRLAQHLGPAESEDTRRRLLGRAPGGHPARGHRHLHLLPAIHGFRTTGYLAWIPDGWTASARRLAERAWDAQGLVPGPLDADTGTLWRTVTPWFAPRHPRRGRDAPADQIRRELRDRGWPEPVSVHLWPPREARGAGFYAFPRRRRAPKSPPAWDRPFGVDLVFERAVRGPFALGYACHFGMGTFATVKTGSR